MIDPLLRIRLAPLVRRYQRLQLWRGLAVCWVLAAAAGFGFVLLHRLTGWASPLTLPALAVLAFAAAIVVWMRCRNAAPDVRWLARQIEQQHPDLHALLLTAVEQQAQDGGELSFLQHRVLLEALEHSQRSNWTDTIAPARLAWAGAAHLAAFAVFIAVLMGLRVSEKQAPVTRRVQAGVTVTPGDTSIERGNSLVVLARFAGPLPANVDLVVAPTAQSSRRIPLVKTLADPVFGGSVPDVTSDFVYHIEYAGQRTRDYRVTVFEHPRLERADANLTYPEYTGLPPKRIEDTRRLSAVEGSRLDLALQLNKPVTSARLVAKDKSAVPLTVETNRAVALLKQFPLEASKTYDLHLVDADGRTNKVPVQFVIDVLKNRPPELKLASPRGDLRPSALEEISFDGSVWDDFGVRAYGLAYLLAGQETKFVELGRSVPGKEKRPFQHLLRLEDFSAQPDQLISWFIWADDIGPDGQVRRTSGDMYFAEVRPFDEIYRQGQASEQPQDESGGQSQQGSPTTRLAELQKQVINATWKLQREQNQTITSQYRKDAPVVRDGQAQALEQAEELKERAADPRFQALWNAVTTEMERALARLTEATNSPAPLPLALAAEHSAYQALLKLQSREYEVTRNRSRSQSQSASQQRNQRQLEQLDLTESENRYETQRQAQPQQSAERREQLQVLNRLQELARRQQDLNERLKELQTALQEARSDAEREEVRRRLKRLREEEQQMLADVDELRQRMERPENQSRMGEERRQLDQVRSEVQRAAEAAEQGAVAQALASGTRAQRELQQLRDDLRRKSSSQFADDMRQMRAEARELSRKQEDVAKQMEALNDNQRKTLSDSGERQEAIDQLARQKGRLTNLVEHATQVSQQAETAEPLLSRQLYDTLRKTSQDDVKNVKDFQEELLRRGLLTQSLYDRLKQTAEREGAKSLELTAEMLRQGYLPQASQAEQRARAGIDDLKRGVERAAESVLGDDTEALRLARKELDDLTEQLNQEMAQADAGASPNAGQPRESTQNRQGNAPSPSGQNRPDQGQDSGERSSQTAQTQNGNQSGQTNPASSPANTSSENSTAQSADQPGTPGQASQPSGSPPTDANRAARQPSRNSQGRAGMQAQSGREGNSTPSATRRENAPQRGGLNRGSAGAAGGDLGNFSDTDWDNFLNSNDTRLPAGPITGENFAPWSDRLRDVEEMLDQPELRNEVAAARERARRMRLDFKRLNQKPDWAVVRLQVVKPLVEVRNAITEELARRDSKDSLVPIDRDPVPSRFAERVRRYYEELGKDK